MISGRPLDLGLLTKTRTKFVHYVLPLASKVIKKELYILSKQSMIDLELQDYRIYILPLRSILTLHVKFGKDILNGFRNMRYVLND